MADLFPTTQEVAEQANAADAAAGKLDIVDPLGPNSFASEGPWPSFAYRPLGLKDLTGGKIAAHVLRATPGRRAEALTPRQTPDFQFLYVLKGWAVFDYEGLGEQRLVEGSAVYQPPGIEHRVIGHSDDFEVLEITLPAGLATTTTA
jgi:mannose-6-phosphate isomerase-like protein (cupin superfamily)